MSAESKTTTPESQPLYVNPIAFRSVVMDPTKADLREEVTVLPTAHTSLYVQSDNPALGERIPAAIGCAYVSLCVSFVTCFVTSMCLILSFSFLF
jgi:hypothetical protein